MASADVRVPSVAPGTAVRVSRYGAHPKAVVIHPLDFERFERLERLLEQAAMLEPLEFSALAGELHRSSEVGEELDLDELGAALGQR